MTINKISGGSFGGVRSLLIDYVENVDDCQVVPDSHIEIPLREGSTSFTAGTQNVAAGVVHELKIQGFTSGIDETNLAGFEALNNRKVIAWFEDYAGQQFCMGKLTEPARMAVEVTLPSDVKTPKGFNFVITSRQTTGLIVI
jgi:hypothetical protein